AGLSLGFLFASLAGQFAFRSIFLDAAILLPQTLVYLPLYRLLIRNNIHREAAFFLKFLLLSALFLAGALSEYFLNPWLLQKTYHLMALLS
ncbi:MAG: hypothetical protein LUC83_09400, partial [Clostridiales bacterium]|nr:hypothetical protein [Clostridiales bacterium]